MKARVRTNDGISNVCKLLCSTDQTYSTQCMCMCRYAVYDGRGRQLSKQRQSAASYPYMWSVEETHVVLSCLHRRFFFFTLQILSGQYCLNCLLLVSLKWSINFTFGGRLTPPVSLARAHGASSCVQTGAAQQAQHSPLVKLQFASTPPVTSCSCPVHCLRGFCDVASLHWWYWASCAVSKQMFHPFDPRVQVG